MNVALLCQQHVNVEARQYEANVTTQSTYG